MIAVIVLVAVGLLGVILISQGRTHPLTLPERAYLCVSPLPVLMTFAVPAAIAFPVRPTPRVVRGAAGQATLASG